MAKSINNFIEIHIITCAQNATFIEEKLRDLGALAITFQDALDQPIFEPPQNMPLWDKTQMIGLFPQDSFPKDILEFLEDAESQGKIETFSLNNLADKDWVRVCLQDFHPISCGKRLWICPSWIEAPEPNAVNVILDPGLSFGTGTHPTTKLCLSWLDENIKGGETVLDYGCGSGILGIAALKLGAKEVFAVDHDPQALFATRENSKRNNLTQNALNTYLPQELPPIKVDILIANILAEPLIKLVPVFKNLLKERGQIILSGILSNQINELIQAYAEFNLKVWRAEENWVLLHQLVN